MRVTAAAIGFLLASGAAAALDPERNHLTCYPVKGKTIRRSVTLENDLGTETIASLKPVQICAPTKKTADPAGTDPNPIVGVPYFTCYKVKVKGKRAKQTVTLTDQFGTAAFSVTRPNLLCAPADVPDGGTTTTTSTTAAPASTSSTSTSSSTVLPTTSTGGVPTTVTTTTQMETTTSSTSSSTSSTAADTSTTSSTLEVTTTTDVTTTTVDTTTTTMAVTTTTDTTTTTVPTCSIAAGDPQLMCTGVCPQGFTCLFTGAEGNPCECSPDASQCPNLSTGQCGGGLCAGGLQACADQQGACVCIDIG